MTEDGKIFPWMGRINTVKMAMLPKAIYMVNVISIEVPMTFITKSNARHITIPHFKLYYSAIAVKSACYWQKKRYEDQ
jgi:hypothetical protein